MHDDCHVVNLDDWVKRGIEKEAGQCVFMASLCFVSFLFLFFFLVFDKSEFNRHLDMQD